MGVGWDWGALHPNPTPTCFPFAAQNSAALNCRGNPVPPELRSLRCSICLSTRSVIPFDTPMHCAIIPPIWQVPWACHLCTQPQSSVLGWKVQCMAPSPAHLVRRARHWGLGRAGEGLTGRGSPFLGSGFFVVACPQEAGQFSALAFGHEFGQNL